MKLPVCALNLIKTIFLDTYFHPHIVTLLLHIPFIECYRQVFHFFFNASKRTQYPMQYCLEIKKILINANQTSQFENKFYNHLRSNFTVKALQEKSFKVTKRNPLPVYDFLK